MGGGLSERMFTPYPGPEPPPFEFPFAEARGAVRVISEVIEDLRHLVRRHEEAAGPMRVGFEGRARTEFDRRFADSLRAWHTKIAGLDAQLDQLEQDIVTAGRRLEQRETERAAWQRRHDAWLEDQQP